MQYKKILMVQAIALSLNLTVAFAKIAYGYLTGSISMEADGFHSLMDGGGTMVGMVGVWVASRPADESHPYGHRKHEPFASLFIALLLLITGFEVARGALLHLQEPVSPRVTSLSFMVMLGTMAVNLFVTTLETRKGREYNSPILTADALHTRSDIFVSIGVIFSLIAVTAGFPVIDVIAGIIIALVIVKSGLDVVRETSYSLLDASVLDADMLCRIALEIEGVEDCHHIRTRGTADNVYVDLHVHVKGELSINEAHCLAHAVENQIKERVNGVKDVVVHLEPVRDRE
ncbi:MAG: cation diffusion facilitator family transporter [ANME-2 cluster archaeon]|nr:cation diffusion facilitator family transporter [ANME-2 cluster archaeon]